jgi:hypothetical protein
MLAETLQNIKRRANVWTKPLLKDRIFLVGAVIIGIMIFIAIFAP